MSVVMLNVLTVVFLEVLLELSEPGESFLSPSV